MQAFTLLFEGSPAVYHKMAKVLKQSVETESTNVDCTISYITDADSDLRDKKYKETYVQNTRKTRHFADLVNNSTNGTVLLLLDCDMLCIKDLSGLDLGDADLALTYRNKSPNRYIFNTGFVAIRVSDRMKDFCNAWALQAEHLLRNPRDHAALRNKYGGINQSSLGYLLEGSEDIRVKRLATTEWNCLPSTYDSALESARLIHLMGQLRSMISYNRTLRGEASRQQIYRLWKQHEEMLASTS